MINKKIQKISMTRIARKLLLKQKNNEQEWRKEIMVRLLVAMTFENLQKLIQN